MGMQVCTDCGTTDPCLHYRSGRMARCYDCQNFTNLVGKATGGGVTFTREEFLAWKRASPERRCCAYCEIDAENLFRLGILNPRNKRVYESIGVDRKDNGQPYTLENIHPCCGPCNATKGGIWTHEEMLRLGRVLKQIWQGRIERLEAAGRAQASPQAELPSFRRGRLVG